MSRLVRSQSFATEVRKVLRYGRGVALAASDKLVRWLVPRRTRNVSLIIRLDAIGDFFIWMQSGAVDLTTFARRQGNRAVLLANASWADYARRLGLWDQVIALHAGRFARDPLYRLRLMVQVRRLGANLLIQPRSAWMPSQEDALASVSGAAVRIGNTGALINLTPESRARGNRRFNRLIEVNTDQRTHETLRNAEFVEKLLAQDATPFDFSTVHQRCTGDFVVVVLGARQTGRIWPVGKLADLMRHVERLQPGITIKLMGSAAEVDLARELVEQAPIAMDNLVGRTSVGELVETIAGARLVICNDSAAFHIAMALHKNVVCFLGGGHFGWFAPYPPQAHSRSRARVLYHRLDCYWCNWNCPYPRAEGGAFKCVDAISVDTAREAVEALLREEGQR